MMGMPSPYERTGRINQKARTRNALVGAVQELLKQGVTPTPEQAAAAASISRTTAYRYFRNQRELLAAAHPEIVARSVLGNDAPQDPEARVEIVIGELARQLTENEAAFRTALRLSLDPVPDRAKPMLRRGRAIRWFEEALEPLRGKIPDVRLHRLALAIRAVFGIEPLVWLMDVAGLSRDEAIDLMRSSAKTLLRAALAEPLQPGGRSATKNRLRKNTTNKA
jgi:AcrR family transcriptional regulator